MASSVGVAFRPAERRRHSGRDYFAAQYPACMCPCQRFDAQPCGSPTHDSGSGWFATPFLCDSFIHYSTPVYPGALRSLLRLVRFHGRAPASISKTTVIPEQPTTSVYNDRR